MYIWSPLPGSTDATVPANWRINGDPATDLPGWDDDVQFVDTGGGGANCTNFGTAGEYYLVYAGRGYAGTITLASGFTVGQFTLESGAVRAGSIGHNITVTAQFVWTGGTLNSSAHLTSLILDGATATIAPLNAGTVTTGSTLKFINGATGSFSPGTVNFLNSAVLTILDECVLSVESVNFVQNPDAENYTGRSDITVRGGTTSYGARVVNWMGTYRFVGQASVFFRGGGPNAPAYSQVRPAANTYIESESKITVTNQDSYVQISGGHLSTLARAGAAVQTATIDGKLLLDGGQVDIVICDGSTPHVFGTLHVIKDVDWQVGTFRPVVNAANPGQADVWKSSGKFTVGALAQLAPGTVNIPPGGVPANQLWLFLEGLDGIVGTPPAVIGGIYTVSPSGSPVKKWFFAS